MTAVPCGGSDTSKVIGSPSGSVQKPPKYIVVPLISEVLPL